MTRPTIAYGSTGTHVVTVQSCLEINVDGDFGQRTDRAVRTFQTAQRLESDGVVGPDTWAAFESVYELPPYPPPLPPPLPDSTQRQILRRAEKSLIGIYSWRDRGVAPAGYTNGMAIAYGTVVRKWIVHDSSAREMAKANTHDSDVDAISWYAGKLFDIGASIDQDGLDTLRALFVLQMGLGMRELSGQHCCGRDMSASNVTSDTAEAGLFQMSWNASGCSDEMQKLMDQFVDATPDQTAIEIFEEGVTCSESDWACYGSGDGYRYQDMAKNMPQFAVETCAVGLRNLRQHWGPINRYEAEVRPEADELLRQVEEIAIGAIA